MLSILYPYRNRSTDRLKRSFESLRLQTDSSFEVHFIDYGSNSELANKMENLCGNYQFINYQFYPTQFQPWNKSRALNSVIKNLKTDFCFVADADIIFHPQFVEIAKKLMKSDCTTYFQVGYLNVSDSKKNNEFHEFKNYRLSNEEATGLSLFPVKVLKELNGFDEFYHFWGAEDTDMHIRIKNSGYEIEFYNAELLLLHQWHESYQRRESEKLSNEFQLGGILTLNHQHLVNAKSNRVTIVNVEAWGEILNEEEYNQLEEAELFMEVTNEKRQIEDVLFGQLPKFNNRIIKIRFVSDPFEKTFKYRAKRLLGKKVPEYYTLQQINDMILLHLISFYRNKPYSVKVNSVNREIEIAIKFC